jgi:hypothetical protein
VSGQHSQGSRQPKESYKRPALLVLGTVAALTQAKGQAGADRTTNSSG